MLRSKNALASTCGIAHVTTLGMHAAGGVLHANVWAALVEDMCMEVVTSFCLNRVQVFYSQISPK